MKNLLNSCLGLVLVLLSFGCNSGPSDSVEEAKDSNVAKIDSQQSTVRPSDADVMLSKEDADFLVNAASGAMMEVELGRLAQTNSTTQRVKAFGATMVKDHGEGIEKIKALAARKHVVLPDSVSSRQQDEIDDLKKRKGNDFDKRYVTLMFNDHKNDIKEFEKQAGKGTDSLTRIFASSSLGILRRHLDSADNLQALLGINNVNPQPITPK